MLCLGFYTNKSANELGLHALLLLPIRYVLFTSSNDADKFK